MTAATRIIRSAYRSLICSITYRHPSIWIRIVRLIACPTPPLSSSYVCIRHIKAVRWQKATWQPNIATRLEGNLVAFQQAECTTRTSESPEDVQRSYHKSLGRCERHQRHSQCPGIALLFASTLVLGASNKHVAHCCHIRCSDKSETRDLS